MKFIMMKRCVTNYQNCFLIVTVCLASFSAKALNASILYERIKVVDPLRPDASGGGGLRKMALTTQVRALHGNAILAEVFKGVFVTMSDRGREFIATSESDTGFDELTRLLTDGVPQRFTRVVGPGAWGTTSECNYFNPGSCFSSEPPDLFGYKITRITFQLNDWYQVSPGTDPNGNDNSNWVDTFFGYRFAIEGFLIPEPNTATSVTIAIVLSAILLRCPRSFGCYLRTGHGGDVAFRDNAVCSHE